MAPRFLENLWIPDVNIHNFVIRTYLVSRKFPCGWFVIKPENFFRLSGLLANLVWTVGTVNN
jgi:hypothetical protein